MKIKQDINFLDKPLWFQKSQSDKNGIVWTDIDGFFYRTAYKLPEKTDMLVLLFVILKSQEADYQQNLVLTRYEIVKKCGFTIDSKIYSRIEDSFKRWANVTVEFQGSFYDGSEYLSIVFHILDSYKIRKEDGKIEINLDPTWLFKIKESNFFKYINFDYYKALKRPISRRLFEILCKTFKGRNQWQIDLIKLGQKLTLSGKKVVRKGGIEKEVLYPNIVLTAIKPAINEINKLAENQELLNAIQIKAQDAFKISYWLSENKKLIFFEKVLPDWATAEKTETSELETETKINEIVDFEELVSLLKTQTNSLKEMLTQYASKKGGNYVKYNILYANQHATKNYAVFLKKALDENWGKTIEEEVLKKQKADEALKEEKARKRQEIENAYLKLEELKIAYQALDDEDIMRLEPLAIERCVALGMPISFIPKITLMEKIVELHKEEQSSS